MRELLPAILSTYALQIPLFIVWAAGIGLSLATWSRWPRRAVLALAAFGVFFLRALAYPAVSQWLLFSRDSLGFPLEYGYLILNVSSALIATVGWILLVVALFARRSRHAGNSETRFKEVAA